jgi:hypothetical protein
LLCLRRICSITGRHTANCESKCAEAHSVTHAAGHPYRSWKTAVQ